MRDRIRHRDADLTPASPKTLPSIRPHRVDDGARDPQARLLTEADCQNIAQRLAQAAYGGGLTTTLIWSNWTSSVRWARNQVLSGNELRNDVVRVVRDIHGATDWWVLINETTDAALVSAVHRAERIVQLHEEAPLHDVLYRHPPEPLSPSPPLFFDTTAHVDVPQQLAAATAGIAAATAAGMLSAGYVEVGAYSIAMIDTAGHTRYTTYTTAQYSVTVRDPKGTGSGWAGIDSPDWSKLDPAALSGLALAKCVQSRNPVAVEPGRYVTILEPQAVGDFVGAFVGNYKVTDVNDHWNFVESDEPTRGPFGTGTWAALKGRQVMDERITITADPSDPGLAFPAFNPLPNDKFSGPWFGDYWEYDTYHPLTLVENGVLKQLTYTRSLAKQLYHQDLGLPPSGAFRMTGGDTSVEAMIASTTRGILVTRFSRVELQGMVLQGYTRDGLWLIEHGKIVKPIKNMVFTESPIFALNNVEQLGVPQRVFHPKGMDLSAIPHPIIVPPLKVRDFSFTALADAV